eukprot:495318-Heterocapsa_arctica.AAC.1
MLSLAADKAKTICKESTETLELVANSDYREDFSLLCNLLKARCLAMKAILEVPKIEDNANPSAKEVEEAHEKALAEFKSKNPHDN